MKVESNNELNIRKSDTKKIETKYSEGKGHKFVATYQLTKTEN